MRLFVNDCAQAYFTTMYFFLYLNHDDEGFLSASQASLVVFGSSKSIG
jgi:hypothetical protein